MDRRDFLEAGAGVALLCTIGGERMALRTREDAERADAAARAIPRPRAAAKAEPADALTFGTPKPQPGGVAREYWIQARVVTWDMAPTGRDDWHGHAIPQPRRFKAVVYHCLLYTSPSPRDGLLSRMPSSA